MPGQGRWYERDMTRRRPSRARLRPFRLDDAADLCRIYALFFVDNAVKYGKGRIIVAEADCHAVGFVMWGPAFEPAWFDPGVERWAELDELHVHPDYQGQGIGTRLVRAAVQQARSAVFQYVNSSSAVVPASRVSVGPVSFVPPNGSWTSAPIVGAFTYVIPASSSCIARNAHRRSFV